MHDKEIKKLRQQDGVTYVNGLGFIGSENQGSNMANIRRFSMFISISLLIYFLCRRIFALPATNIANYMGFDVSINKYTGMIITSPVSNVVISFFISFASILVTIGFVYLLTARDINLWQIFSRPAYGITSIAIPIIMATNVLGGFLANAFGEGALMIGFIFPSATAATATDNIELSITILATSIILCVIEEILFNGIILSTLRRFGDDLAVICTAILCALFRASALGMILTFFIALVVGYFVVRSGSVFVAIIGKICIILYNFATSLCMVYFEKELAFVIISLMSLTLIGMAGITYIYFLKKDKNAFLLIKPSSNMSLRRRIVTFASSPIFIVFVVFMGLIILSNMQIIG